MELINNEIWFCSDDLNGVNLCEDQAGKYISIELAEHEPIINIYLTKKDFDYFFKRMEEINDEYYEENVPVEEARQDIDEELFTYAEGE